MKASIKYLRKSIINLSISVMKFMKIIGGNKKALIGLIILLFFFFIALFGRSIFPYDETTVFDQKYAAPSMEHWLGTDNLGRDLFTQMVHGARDVLSIAFLTAVITIVIGATLGLGSGLMGGWIDKLIQIITNLFLTVPSFPILLVLASMFTIEDALTFALVLSVWNWAGLCRAIRSQIISLKERDFIQICHVMGLSKFHIIFKELLPNVASFILINFIIIMRNAITGSVGIMILGLAAFEPSNWGAILLRAKDSGALLIPEATLFWISPIICIMLFQMGAVLFSNGLDEALNPRLRKN
jgi:peptide/nickel transport system permease protein